MMLFLALASAFFYIAAAAWQVRTLTKDARGSSVIDSGAVGIVACALHAAVHATVWHSIGGIDLHFFAALSLIGLGSAALTAGLSLVRRIGALGIVAYPIAALTLLLYQFTSTSTPVAAVMGWQIQLHAALSLLAYAALSLAALLAIVLWMQERALRQRRFGPLLQILPPLTLVETLMFRQIFAGFALLTLALLAGLVFVDNLFAQHLVHKTVLSLLAWAVFGALLYGRVRHGWRGRRAVHLTLTAMILLGLAFFGSKFVLELILNRGG